MKNLSIATPRVVIAVTLLALLPAVLVTSPAHAARAMYFSAKAGYGQVHSSGYKSLVGAENRIGGSVITAHILTRNKKHVITAGATGAGTAKMTHPVKYDHQAACWWTQARGYDSGKMQITCYTL